MKRIQTLALLALMASGSAAFSADITIKPGLWEAKTLHQIIDGVDVTAKMEAFKQQQKALIARLPAEQRKQAEAEFEQRACVPPSIAADYGAWIEHNSNCKLSTKPSILGNKMHFQASCVQRDQVAVGEGDAVMGSDLVTVHMVTEAVDAQGGKHKVQTDWQSKYLGADCHGLAPLDKVSRN